MEVLIADPAKLISKYQAKGLLLDANLLLLFVIGSNDPSLIGKRKLSQYLAEDFVILKAFVRTFAKLVTTPHILTEVSNLLGDYPENQKRRELFRSFARSMTLLQEEHAESQPAAERSEFVFLGLTDCVSAELADQFLVLSSDARMIVKLQEASLDALNFNHFRDELQNLV